MTMQYGANWLEQATDFFFQRPGTPTALSECGNLSVLWSENEHRLIEEYGAVIEGTGDIWLPLWSSAATEGRMLLLDETTLEIKEWLNQAGLAAAPTWHQLPDYIGTELAALGRVLDQPTLRDTLISRWLLPLTTALADAVSEHDLSPFWPNFFEWLQQQLRFIQSEPAVPAKETPYIVDAVPSEHTDQMVMTVGRGNCGGRCMIRSHCVDGCVVNLETDCDESKDTTVILKACSKGHGYRKTFLSPKRLRYPMKRVGARGEGRFQRISWDEAIDTIASELKRVRETYGPGARYVNYASGINAVLRGNKFAMRLLAQDGGYLGSYNTYSAACTEVITPYIYGTMFAGSTCNTFAASNLLVLWGFNPTETMFTGEIHAALLNAKRRGIPIIVIDPRFSDTAAAFATEWIGLRPTTDSALADGIAYVILTEQLEDRAFLDRYCLGFDRAHMPPDADPGENVSDYLLGVRDGIPKTPDWASAITGVPAEQIISLARRLATVKPAAIVPGLGVQRHGNGEQTVRSVAMLACMTGNVGVEGGHSGGYALVHQHKWPELPIPDNPYPGIIPSFLWTDAVDHGAQMTAKQDRIRGMDKLDSPIKLILNLAGNTLINQHSDCTRTAELLKDTTKCELIVVSDVFMTASAKFADILLPGVSMFESWNINLPWREGNFLLCSRPAVSPLFECREEYDWLSEVAERLGIGEEFRSGNQTVRDWAESLYCAMADQEPELPDFSVFVAAGGHKYRNHPHFVAFKQEIEDPEHHPFTTPSGKIELYSTRIKESTLLPAIPCYTPSFEGPSDPLIARYPLQLIGWHNKTHCHSVHDNSEWLDDVEPNMLWMHPDDASRRDICEGDLADVWNERGILSLPVHVTRRIVPGVVAMPQGGWYNPNPAKDRCINTLSTWRASPFAKGNPQHTNLVEVKKAGQQNENHT